MELASHREAKAPPKLESSVHAARGFYRDHNALPLYENHCKYVLQKACSVGIVEPKVIADADKDLKRAWVNSDIATIILFHVVDHEKIKTSAVQLPPALSDETLLREIRIFCELIDLIRRGAEPHEYVPLLNNGLPPLALAALVADYAVTHRMEDRLQGLVCKHGSPIFRMYTSREEARESMKMEAKAGERILAPIADHFGWPGLAGDIFLHAYRVNHRAIYDHVRASLDSDRLQSQIDFTQSLVRTLQDQIDSALAKLGFSAAITPRLRKHDGKIMKKVRMKLSQCYTDSGESGMMSLEDYLLKHVRRFDLATLSDLVALRVILDRYKGREIDSMGEDRKTAVIQKALSTIQKILDKAAGRAMAGFNSRHEFKNKQNGYRAHHIDVEPSLDDSRPTKFEIQLKTTGWHMVAENGDATHTAAHALYVWGSPDLVQVVREAYKNLIHVNGNGQK